MTDMVKNFKDAESVIDARTVAASNERVPMNLAAIFGSLGINVRNDKGDNSF